MSTPAAPASVQRKQMRHWPLILMLYCPLRSPFRASSRLAGGTRRSSRRRELFSIRSFLRATSWIEPGRRLERSPRQIFSASFERKLRIMRHYNAPRYSASRTRRGATPSRPAPHAREPGLPLARQALGPVVVLELRETGRGHEAPPGFQVVIRAVAAAVPALLVVAVRVRAEQHAPGLQARAQLAQDAGQLLPRHVEQHRVGEHAVEARGWERQREQILPPHLAAAVLARHRGEAPRSLQADRDMAEIGKRLQVPPGPAAQVENRERRFALDVSQQRRDVLADVVIARALPETLGAAIVVIQSAGGDVFKILPPEGHRQMNGRVRTVPNYCPCSLSRQ